MFKSTFQCRLSASVTYSSFELQLFELNASPPTLCAVVYRPPIFNKDFMQEFADFIAGVRLNYDHFIICGDFNLHVCCESKPVVKDFLNLLNS